MNAPETRRHGPNFPPLVVSFKFDEAAASAT